MESLPTLQSLQLAIGGNCGSEPEDELLSVMTHLLVCAIGENALNIYNMYVCLFIF